MPVSAGPGMTQLAVTPCVPSSTARDLVNPAAFPADRYRIQGDSLASAATTVSILTDEIVRRFTPCSPSRRISETSETPMICVSALYPNQPGSRFDGAY